jgi:dipeptidyl aminopeptidase/acylaminoacyl peptidase
MFSYFPGNYVWNLSVCIALESGAKIGEIDEMCAPLREAAAQGDDVGTTEFMNTWVTMADKLVGLADEDAASGRGFSAADKLDRAALYYQIAERMQPHTSAERHTIYAKSIDSFTRAIELGGASMERVEIPYLDGVIPGWFQRAGRGDEPRPTVVYVNGLDSTKEMLVWSFLGDELARRGVNTLHIDQPGTGETLRLSEIPATAGCEWATTVYESVAARPDVDAEQVGISGISLGGYYAPRALVAEPRFALGACWGANHKWGEVQRRRLENEGERPVPHYWEHVRWVWGAKDQAEFLAMCPQITLDGLLDQVTAPFLVTHGQHDRQIPLEYAHQTFDQLVNSSKREMKIFDERTGGVQHVSVDNMNFGRHFIADWIAETFGETAGPVPASGKASS